MERNDFPTGSGPSAPTNRPDDATFGGSTSAGTTSDPMNGSASTANSTGTPGATTGSTGGAPTSSASIGDRARSLTSEAGDRLADVGSNLRDRAGSAKAGLADALESGAERLRSRGEGAMVPAGATDAGSIGVTTSATTGNELTDRVATGMQQSADWLRDIDLDGLKSSLERQAKEHPGRTLIIAAGLGYLIGKAFRR